MATTPAFQQLQDRQAVVARQLELAQRVNRRTNQKAASMRVARANLKETKQ